MRGSARASANSPSAAIAPCRTLASSSRSASTKAEYEAGASSNAKAWTAARLVGTSPCRRVSVSLSTRSGVARILPKACAAVVFTSLVERAMWRYRDPRSFRAILVDVGHAVMAYRHVARTLGFRTYAYQKPITVPTATSEPASSSAARRT